MKIRRPRIGFAATVPHAEPLEPRRFLSVSLGTNLVLNPGAESNSGDHTAPSNWQRVNGSAEAVKYGENGSPPVNSPGPASRGTYLFGGGPGPSSDLFQTIDLSSIGGSIDAKKIQFSLSAYLGGNAVEADNATLFVNFQDANDGLVSQVALGPVTPGDRGNASKLLFRSASSTVPSAARFAQVQLHFERSFGNYADGYADNLSLVLTQPGTPAGSVGGAVFNDANGDGSQDNGEGGAASRTVYVDLNNNGSPDAGEPSAVTGSGGTYLISNVKTGSQVVRLLPAPGTSQTFPASNFGQHVTVAAGQTTSNVKFGTKAASSNTSAVISGTVFTDANGNKTKDSTEKGIKGAVVYLDFNNNAQPDSFELKTTTDDNGNYSFTLPFGTYTVREVVASGKTQTTPSGGYTLTVSKGQTVSGKNFGVK